jgi:hypothetical protein
MAAFSWARGPERYCLCRSLKLYKLIILINSEDVFHFEATIDYQRPLDRKGALNCIYKIRYDCHPTSRSVA